MNPYSVHDISAALAAIDQIRQPPHWLARAWQQQPQICTTTAAGATLCYRGWNLQRRDLPALLFVHGYMAHARWWDHIAPFFSADYRVAAMDLCGMGDSDHRPHYSRQGYAEDILAVLDAAGFAGATVIAHSFGGTPTAIAAQLAPARFRRVILVDTTLQLSDSEYAAPTHAKKYYTSAAAALQRFRLAPPGKSHDPFLLHYIAEHSIRASDDGWSWKFDERMGACINTDTPLSLKDFAVPADLIYGELSEFVQPAVVARIRAALPSLELAIAIPAAHHHIMLEQPLALVTALRTLLAQPRQPA